MRVVPRNELASQSSGYKADHLAAFDRTQALGLKVPPLILVEKDCVDPDKHYQCCWNNSTRTSRWS